jgi:macrolide-specific efflux system membrane fusion protein
MTIPKKWLALILAIIVVASFFIIKKKSHTDEKTFTVKKGSIVEAVYGIGTVTASRSYHFKTAVPLTLTRLFVHEGDKVTEGQTLMVLESPITAPFSGTITALNYKEGETIAPQTSVFSLVDTKNRYLTVTLDQEAILRVKQDQRVVISFDSNRKKPFYGNVRTIFSNDNQFYIHVDVPHLPIQFLPGMTSDVAIEISKKEGVLLLPMAAVNEGIVTLKQGKKTKTVAVTLGIKDGTMAEITSTGLKEGDVLLSH